MMDSVGTGTCFGMRIKRAHRDGMDAWNEGLKRRFMNHSPMRLIVLVAVCIPSIQSCSASPTVPDFYGVGPADEQSTIGEYYRQEAAVFRQRANVMAERATAYRQLFGEESEWVSGARALGEFYQQKARERERLADQYQSPSGDHVQPAPAAHEHRGSPK
jgi:hypothetical protein